MARKLLARKLVAKGLRGDPRRGASTQRGRIQRSGPFLTELLVARNEKLVAKGRYDVKRTTRSWVRTADYTDLRRLRNLESSGLCLVACGLWLVASGSPFIFVRDRKKDDAYHAYEREYECHSMFHEKESDMET